MGKFFKGLARFDVELVHFRLKDKIMDIVIIVAAAAAAAAAATLLMTAMELRTCIMYQMPYVLFTSYQIVKTRKLTT